MKRLLVLNLLFALLLPREAGAVNFYDGVHAPDGLYLLSYTTAYLSTDYRDAEGKSTATNMDYRSYGEMLRLSLYKGDACFHLLAPISYVDFRSADSSKFGFGDVNPGIGYFLPVKFAHIVPMLFVKIPTGSYDSNRSANPGSGQWDIKPTLFIHKTLGPWTTDLALKYYYRLQNLDTNSAPRNEFYAQGLFGYEFWNFMKLGLSMNWMSSDNMKYFDENSATSPDKMSFSLGSDIYFRFKPLSISFTYLRDVYAENSLMGNFFQMKLVYKL